MALLKVALISLIIICFQLEGQDSRILDRLEYKKQYLQLSYHPEKKEIVIESKNGRIFSWTQRQRFKVNNDHMIDQSLMELAAFIQRHSLDESFFDSAASYFNEYRILNDRECRALFLSLSGPLAAQGIDSLIEQLDQVGKFLEAPDDAVRSFDIEEINLLAQKIGLRLYVNSKGEAVSLGMISKDSDFVGYRFQGSIKDGYSLFSPRGDWLFGLHVQNDDEILIKTTKPSDTSQVNELIVNTESSLTRLTMQADVWQIDDGQLGVDEETYSDEWLSISRTKGLEQFSSDITIFLEKSYHMCRVYEDQRRSRESIGSICENYIDLETKFLKTSKEVKEMGLDQSVFKKNALQCLSLKGLISENNKYRSLNSPFPQDYQQIVDSCLNEVILPFKQDHFVLTVTESNLGQKFLRDEALKKSFSETLHLQGFQYCEKQKLKLEDSRCIDHLKEMADDFFVTSALSEFSLQDRSVDHRQADKNRSHLVTGWESCAKQDKNCINAVLIDLTKIKNSSTSPMVQDFPVNVNLDVSSYPELKETFDNAMLRCVSGSIDNLETLEQIILSYEELRQRCVKKSSLQSFKFILKDHLKNIIFKNVYSFMPGFFDNFINQQVVVFSDRIDNGDFSSIEDLATKFNQLMQQIYAKGIAGAVVESKNTLFPTAGTSSVFANHKYQQQWEQSVRALLSIPVNEPIENGIEKLLQPLNLQSSQVHTNDILKNVTKISSKLVLKRELQTKVQDSSKRQNIELTLNNQFKDCVDTFSSNQLQSNISGHLNNCELKRDAQIMFEQAKEKFEKDVSHSFALSSTKSNQILSPIWELSYCIGQQPSESLERQVYIGRVQACIDIAKMDIGLKLAMGQLDNISPLLHQRHQDMPATTARSCFTSLLIQMASKDENLNKAINNDQSYVHLRERSRSLMAIQTERLTNGRSMLSYLNRTQYATSNSFALSDASKMSTFIRDLSASAPKFPEFWIDGEIAKCLEAVAEVSLVAIRESFIQNSPYFQNTQANRVGETDAQVMRSILDNETIQLVLQMRDHQEGLNLKAIVDPRERLMTREFTMDTLARSSEVISQYLGQGFIFDRNILKTELVIFRSELNEALRWMNSQEGPVAMKELADFFKSSELANILATAEISSQVQGRFLAFISQMEINELADFNRRVGHRPEYRQTQAQKDEKKRIVEKYNNLRALTKEMTSSYDFRRIVMQDPRKGQQLLELIKATSLLPKIAGQEVSPSARSEIWKKIGELILQDNTPGGFAERFVAEIAQNYLDQERDAKWRITRWLFYNDGDFKWDSLRSTAAGRRALNYYSRYLLLPKVLDIRMSTYLKNLREEEFKRYLRRAQSEN